MSVNASMRVWCAKCGDECDRVPSLLAYRCPSCGTEEKLVDIYADRKFAAIKPGTRVDFEPTEQPEFIRPPKPELEACAYCGGDRGPDRTCAGCGATREKKPETKLVWSSIHRMFEAGLYGDLTATLPVKKPAPLKVQSTPKRSWFERWFRGIV